MDTFHKLAGVQDASDARSPSAERPSQPQILTEPPPAGTTAGVPAEADGRPMYAQSNPSHSNLSSHRASRASLPLGRQASRRSLRSAKSQHKDGSGGGGDGWAAPAVPAVPSLSPRGTPASSNAARRERYSSGASVDGGASAAATGSSKDFAWGPSHPCFPHPNPHCAPDSAEFAATKVIRVKRDWLQAGDLYPQYANLYPEILDPHVTEAEFRYLVSHINAHLKTAFSPAGTRAWIDSLMGAATGFLWEDAGLTRAKREERALEQFLDDWNYEREHEGREVRVVQLRRTGFMSLDFVVPDPEIEGVTDDGEDEDGVQDSPGYISGTGGIGPAQ